MAESSDTADQFFSERTEREKTLQQLVTALEDYNTLLSREIESMIGLAVVHGWSSGLANEGSVHRAKISELKSKL